MPWARFGDTIITHPRLMRLHEVDSGSTSVFAEAFGFLALGATMSAAHLTDYRVEFGSWVVAAGGNARRAKELLEILEQAGLVERVQDGDHLAWTIWEDDDFIHLRSKAEVEIDRQRKRDLRNTDVTIAVRVRDGDQCRYCGKTVSWTDRKSARSATYDHIDGVGDDVDTDGLVVCCRSCNTSLRGRSGDVKRRMLLPIPQSPFFSRSSAAFINNSAWASERGIKVKASLRPGEIPDARIGGSSNDVGGKATQVADKEPIGGAGGTVQPTVSNPRERGDGAPHHHSSDRCSESCCHTESVVVEEDIASLSGGAGEAWLEPLRETGKRLPTVDQGACTTVCECTDGNVVVEEDIASLSGGAGEAWLEPLRETGKSLPSSDQGACVVSVHGASKGASEAPTKRGSCNATPSVGVAKAARRRHSRRRSQQVGETS